MELLAILLITLTGGTVALWNNLSCPAPRSPENGLSFIFRNGELVHFRCHPGYVMRGKSVAYCVNSHWTVPAPECFPAKKGRRQSRAHDNKNIPIYNNRDYYSHQTQPQRNMSLSESRRELNSKLFNWEKKGKKGAYGDGPRRMPIINGIWPGEPVQVMSLGPQSTPGPRQLIRDEVNIAELRQKQYEEVAHHRHSNPNLDLLPAKRNKKRKNKKLNSVIPPDEENGSRQTVISLGQTEDGDALSIAFAKPANETNEITSNESRHKYRHRDQNVTKKRKMKTKKSKKNYDYPSNIIARTSRVETSGVSPYQIQRRYKSNLAGNEVAELRRRPVQNVRDNQPVAQYDTSCIESFYGRELPKMAPQVANAFVYRYETKKNREFPFNSYMQVKYRCLSGYSFADGTAQILNCHDAKWVGDMPRCVQN